VNLFWGISLDPTQSHSVFKHTAEQHNLLYEQDINQPQILNTTQQSEPSDQAANEYNESNQSQQQPADEQDYSGEYEQEDDLEFSDG
jgi:hypothetical protein